MMKNIPKAGEVVTLDRFIHADPYSDDLILFGHDASSSGYPCLGKTTVSFTMPDGDAIKAMISLIEEQIKTERADHHVKITQLEDKMQQLLAIGHDGGVA